MSISPSMTASDYKAYYFPDRGAESMKGEAAADAEFDQMQPHIQPQDANLGSTDADVLNESSCVGNPASAEPGSIQSQEMDMLESSGYSISGVDDEGKVNPEPKMPRNPQHTSDKTPAERLAYYRPYQGHWAPPQKNSLGADISTNIKDDADVDADDDLHKALDMDSPTSRRAGLGAKVRGMDEDADADVEGENELEPGAEGYTITGVEDEGEQLNS
ncbi:hypothetical protein BDW68DRAFT_192093 [Aspergillus falconensis]